jgi:hypothetical protein
METLRLTVERALGQNDLALDREDSRQRRAFHCAASGDKQHGNDEQPLSCSQSHRSSFAT